MLWVCESSSFTFFVIWDTSQENRLGVTGCSTLGVGTTLGGLDVGAIIGVGSDTPLVCWKGIWDVENMPGIGNLDPGFCVSATCTLLVCLGGAIGGVRS